MTIDELLTKTAREMGFPEELLKRASDYAKTQAGISPSVDEKLKRDLTPDEIAFYKNYTKWIVDACREVPGFREVFLKGQGLPEIPSDS